MAQPSQERLDQLDDQIEQARRGAEDDGLLPDDDEPTLIDPNPDDGDDVDEFRAQPPG
jgi:hypothetical protein